MTDAEEPVRVLGVLAGADMPPDQLKLWVESAQILLAADGGADRLHALGVIPKTTLGDLDSISEEISKVQTHLIKDEDQNSTDCDKLLAFALHQGYEAITLAGVEGDLLDHVIGTIHSAAKSALRVRLALRRGIGELVRGPIACTYNTVPQARFSVIPLVVCEGVSLTGTRWELQSAVLEPFGLTSLSNISERTQVEFEMTVGRAFVFWETDGSPDWGSR